MNDDVELVAVFKAEVGEQLESLDDHLAQSPASYRYDDLFHLAHNVKGAARMVGAPGLTEAAHALEDLFDALRGGRPASDETTALMREGATQLRRCFDALDSGSAPDVSAYVRRVAEALSTEAVAASGSDEANLAPTNGEDASASGIDDPAARDRSAPDVSATIRIAVDKLERLMGLSAEFSTTAQRSHEEHLAVARVLEHAERLRKSVAGISKNPEFTAMVAAANDIRRSVEDEGSRGKHVAEELQSAIRHLRMIRVDTLRALLGRIARGAAEAHGREVRFEMVGGETEIDRVILDRLRDPLVHLVRNAIAHGIEAPSRRVELGKRALGTVTLRAESAGAWVEIVIADDGRGIDLEGVRRRAIGLGLVEPQKAAMLSEEETTELVFHPGLSTASKVTELAGRGFGMDIVRSNLVELGGSATIATTDGRGTEIRLRAPLTLLTTRVLVASIAGQPVAVPMMNVERALSVDRANIRVVDGREVIPLNDQLMPIASLATTLGISHEGSETMPALVISEGHRRSAVLVDEIVGERELTMQALGWNLAHVPCIAGAAVIEDGEVVLVLHAHELAGARAHGGTNRSVAREGQAANERRRTRVLLVDDSVTSRTLQKNILASAGYEVRTATDGSAALDILREDPAEIVISDVEMPKMNGIELTTRIRASKELSRLPVILVTSLGSEADRDRGAAAGADAYIVKGEFDQDELLRAVARLV